MSQTKAQLLGPLVGDDIGIEGDLDLNNGALKIDVTNDRVGVNNASPAKTLDVGGDGQFSDLYLTADYPTIRPTLDLAFDKVKRLDSRVTFTRTSTATYVDENGIIQTAAVDEPRFDHDPTTGESLGLLVEESRTNLFAYSDNFNDPSWTINNATITSNTATAPDGTNTADLYSGTSTSGVSQSASLTSGVTYTISCYIKSAGLGNDSFRLRIEPTQTSSNFTATSEWQRFSFTTTSANTGLRSCGILRNSSSDNVDIFIWGAQLEVGSFPTSYIPTSGSTVTRGADVATITGDNFSSFYNPTEGTIFAEYQNPKPGDTNNRVWCVELNSNQTLNIIPQYNEVQGQYYNFAYEYNPGYVPATQTFNKVALGFQDNNTNLAVNGTIGEDDTSISLIDFRSGYFNIGRSQYYSPRELNGCIKRLTYYPRRLNNLQMRNITL